MDIDVSRFGFSRGDHRAHTRVPRTIEVRRDGRSRRLSSGVGARLVLARLVGAVQGHAQAAVRPAGGETGKTVRKGRRTDRRAYLRHRLMSPTCGTGVGV